MATALLSLPERPRSPSHTAAPSDRSQARELFDVLRAHDEERPEEGPLPLLVRRIGVGATVQFQGSPVESIHIVRSGAFKCMHVLEDGYEQVVRLAERSDVIGFEGLCRGVHQTTAVALEVSTVYVLPVHDLDALQARAPRLNRALRTAVSRELGEAARMADMMAAVASGTRIARFLRWSADRASERGESPHRLRLRLGRRDIASLLGVAHETVSRSLTALVQAGVLVVDNRDIDILDRAALEAWSRDTRRPADGGPARPAKAAPGAVGA